MKSMFEIHNRLLFEGTHMAIPVTEGKKETLRKKPVCQEWSGSPETSRCWNGFFKFSRANCKQRK